MFTNKDKGSPEGTVKITQTDYQELIENNKCVKHLSSENQELKKKISELEVLVTKLSNQVKTKSLDKVNVTYSTDEDELEKEFNPNGLLRQSKRRRKTKIGDEEPSNNIPPKKTEPKPKNPPLPPPINVSNVTDFNNFSKKILEVASSAQFKTVASNDLKVTMQNEDDYRKVKKFIELQNSEESEFKGIVYHTYQLKSEKSYRAVIRGLHPTCDENDIKNELIELGHEPSKITNIIKKIKSKDGESTVIKYPLFLIELKQKENNKEIFSVTNLLHSKIIVEQLRQTKNIPQCMNCQQLGHTKNFCNRESVCVKCAGKHKTEQCTKKGNATPKCALCNKDGHTANYKGCPAYQKKLKSQNQPAKSAVNRLREHHNTAIEAINPTTTGLSYAQVTKKNTEKTAAKKSPQPTEQSNNDIMLMLKKMQADIKDNIGQLSNRLAKLEQQQLPKNAKRQKKQK